MREALFKNTIIKYLRPEYWPSPTRLSIDYKITAAPECNLPVL